MHKTKDGMDYAQIGREVGNTLWTLADALPVRPEWQALPPMKVDGERQIPKNIDEQLELCTQFKNYLYIQGAAPWPPATRLEQMYAYEYFVNKLINDGVPPWRPEHPLEKEACHSFPNLVHTTK